MSMNPFYTSHRIGQLILKRSALGMPGFFIVCNMAINAWRFGRKFRLSQNGLSAPEPRYLQPDQW